MVMKPMNGNTKWLITLLVTVFVAGGAWMAVKVKADNNKEQIDRVEQTHEDDMKKIETGIGVIQTDVKEILKKM